MSNTFLVTIAGIFVIAILVLRFIDFFIQLLPNELKKGKIFKTVILSTIGLGAIIAILYFLVSSSKLGSVYRNNNPNRAYYEDPDYWSETIFYRNDQVTKIYNQHFGTIALLGKWAKVEERVFSIREVSTGFEIVENIWEIDFYNDSILTVDIERNNRTQSFKYHFNKNGKLAQVTEGNTKQVLTYQDSKFIGFTYFIENELNQKSSITYIGNYDYKYSFFDSEGNLIQEQIWKHNLRGFPISSVVKKQFLRKTQIGGLLEREKTVFDVAEENNYKFQRGEKEWIFKNLQDRTEKKWIIGKNRELLIQESPRELGEGLDVYRNDFEFDKNGNWIVRIGQENNLIKLVALRRITYQDGTSEGTTNPAIINTLKKH